MQLYLALTIPSHHRTQMTNRAFSQEGSPPAKLLSLEVPKTVIDEAGETSEKDPDRISPHGCLEEGSR